MFRHLLYDYHDQHDKAADVAETRRKQKCYWNDYTYQSGTQWRMVVQKTYVSVQPCSLHAMLQK